MVERTEIAPRRPSAILLPPKSPVKYFHRPRLLPVSEAFEKETLHMSTFHVEIPPEMLTTSPLFATVVERTETQPLQAFQQQVGVQSRLRNRAFVPDTPDHEVYSVSQFLEHATIPLIASEATTSHAEPAALVTKSEISGTANNAAIVGVGNIVGFLFKYGNNLLIQHALGVALFGLYSVSLSLVTLLGSIFDLGLDNTVIRYISVYRGKKQKSMMRHLLTFCTGMAAITGTLGAVLVLFFAPSLANFVHKPDAIPLLQIMAPVVPLLCMQTVWTSGLQGLKEFKRRVLIQRFVVPLTLFALTAIALFFFRNLTGVAILAFCSTLISTIINLYFLFAAVNRIKGSEDGRYETRSWLSFALPNFLTTIVNTALDSIDTLLLAFFVAANAIGLYAAAIKISNFILIPLATMNIVFTPTIAELFAKNKPKELEAMFKLVTKWTITLSLPIFLIATLFCIPLLQLSGSGFVDAWPLLIALSIGFMISAATGSVGYMLLMTGHIKFSFFNSVSAVILNIALGIILTPRYGAMGTAISTGIAIGAVNLVRLVEVQLLLKMHPYRWEILKPLGAGVISALLTGALLYLLNLTHFTIPIYHVHLSIQLALVPVFMAIYILLLILFKMSPEDKFVLDKFGKRFGRSKKEA